MKIIWTGELSRKDRELINTRVVGKNGLELPPTFDSVERSAISAASFEKHVMETHPCVENDIMPPDQTLVVEAGIKSSMSKKAKQKIDKVLRHRILLT